MRGAVPDLVLQNDIQSVNDTGNVTEDGEEDVDQEIRAATALEEDTERWEDDSKDDLADVAGSERHFDDLYSVENGIDCGLMTFE